MYGFGETKSELDYLAWRIGEDQVWLVLANGGYGHVEDGYGNIIFEFVDENDFFEQVRERYVYIGDEWYNAL